MKGSPSAAAGEHGVVMRRRLLYLSCETLEAGRAAATHVFGIVNAFQRLDWSVSLVAHNGHGHSLGHHASALLRYMALYFESMRCLPKVDAIYVRSHFAAWPVVMIAKLMRKPVFYEVNGPFNDAIVSFRGLRIFSRLIGALYRSQFRSADHIFCVTHLLAEWAKTEAAHDRVSVTPNGYDPSIFNGIETTRPTDLPAEDYVIFYGDIARWHGIDTMLAAARTTAWPPHVRLVLIGKRPSSQKPDDDAAPVTWLAPKAQRDLPAYLNHARAGLVPITDPEGRSRTGVMPLKLIEMLACGIPVIVSDLPGQADMVREQSCGDVFPAGDALALAKSVYWIVANPSAKSIGLRGQAHVEAHYRWDSIAAEIDKVMKTALARVQRGRFDIGGAGSNRL